jgi:hypothetical protein
MLARLGPLSDGSLRGRDLVPVFVETAADLIRYLDIDALRLDNIINEGVDASDRVAAEDIHLLAMSSVQQPYAKLQLSAIGGRRATDTGAGQHRVSPAGEELALTLRQYMYEKYGYAIRPNGAVASQEQDAVA